jgi:hypothetical protein
MERRIPKIKKGVTILFNLTPWTCKAIISLLDSNFDSNQKMDNNTPTGMACGIYLGI